MSQLFYSFQSMSFDDRRSSVGTVAALELTEKGCEGQVSIHATLCSAISFQTPIPFYYSPPRFWVTRLALSILV